MNIRNNRGVTLTDISISIMIIFLFSSLITGLLYNYSTSTKTIQRKAEATYYAVNIIEALKTINYDDLKNELEDENNLKNNLIIKEESADTTKYKLNIEGVKALDLLANEEELKEQDGYISEIVLEKYSDQKDNKEKDDIIIIATVNVEYKVSSNNQNVELRTLLVKENS